MNRLILLSEVLEIVLKAERDGKLSSNFLTNELLKAARTREERAFDSEENNDRQFKEWWLGFPKRAGHG